MITFPLDNSLEKEEKIKIAHKNAIEMCFNLINCAENFGYGFGLKLWIKIGIHFGRLSEGKIGEQKPQLFFLGRTLDLALQIGRFGLRQRILVSPRVHQIIEKMNYYICKKKFEVSGCKNFFNSLF